MFIWYVVKHIYLENKILVSFGKLMGNLMLFKTIYVYNDNNYFNRFHAFSLSKLFEENSD